MVKIFKSPYIRDLYLAYLIDGARRTKLDGYPIIEKWMVSKKPPKELVQWDKRHCIQNLKETAICFYCKDEYINPILSNPKKYVEKFKQYSMICGLDASPYDNMPLVVQKSQIYINIATTYYFGINGIKIIPNIRIGSDETLSCLDAYPKNTLIAIGTNGFLYNLENRYIFKRQLNNIIETLSPSGICVYGPIDNDVFQLAIERNVPLYQYDSFMMKRNKERLYTHER